ncbi:MAG: pilus assembly protein PilP [Gammaproteobacteria bacterium]|nr:pilus assembly protein PilP [Gammaproteobacteria bacterium]MDH5654003.1 pilus assembly protein PilP [Gammaproteobacteria bacterium]
MYRNRSVYNLTITGGRRPATALAACVLLLLTACSGGRYGDLESFIEEVKTSQKGRIDSLPEVKPYAAFTYDAKELRNPFTPYVQETIAPGPNPTKTTRKREPLEQYPLDSLTFVGHLEKSGVRWGLIAAPDSAIYRVKIGNYLGKNYGKIVSISESNIKLVEIIPSGNGGWVDREASLVLSE